ncbi:sulfatase family protein [Niabella soli]|uniref:Sulfatase n=1 Tax=Niabella soli DSM 19437 TaxID=929713 RepID=W0EY38_9BACT|nr:sulfatase [Niabella soli]AHF14016.1 sulfatase [Niabella soli DSM 19437]
MKPHRIRQAGYITGLLLFFYCLAGGNLSAQQAPNIIVFIADDLNQQDVGCYGNADVRTPNMDLLAKEGMRFTKAYAASSMCTPSRSAVFTGLYPYRNGSQMNHFTVRPDIQGLPQFLQKLGYRVVISGKIDVFPLKNFPFEVIGKEFGKYAPVENRVDRKKETVHLIEDHFSKHANQPICLIVAPWLPHVPWFPHKDFDPQQIKMPAYLADTKETRGALASYYQSISAADNMLGEVMQALDRAGQTQHTLFMFTADQGAQFPSAKWTVYDKGLKVPLIVRWPGHTAKGTVSDALISLVDIAPTLVDAGGGVPVTGLDGKSFKPVLDNAKMHHHDFVFAETSVEPHFWYNYTPARSIITADGWHYIKNYHPGKRFITHIDKVERNEFYFDSWVEAAVHNQQAQFLLNRYSYHPPEEIYNDQKDPEEFHNLAQQGNYKSKLDALRDLLTRELSRQGETDEMIKSGPLPQFFDNSYVIAQNKSASDLSFNRKRWNPDVLYITAYLTQINKGGVVCDYFNNFKLFAYKGKIGIGTGGDSILESTLLPEKNGQLVFRLTKEGALSVLFNNREVLATALHRDLTKIQEGYVTCGMLQGLKLEGRLQPYEGTIRDLQFVMNQLDKAP